jgi:hypothetical protein
MPTMTFNPHSYSPAAMARVRTGWRSHPRPAGALAGMGRIGLRSIAAAVLK